MKKCNFAKISVLILALSVCFGTVFAMSANADNTGTKPEIISQNVKYTDQFCLMYAVDSSAVAPVTLNVYRAVPNEETPATTAILLVRLLRVLIAVSARMLISLPFKA